MNRRFSKFTSSGCFVCSVCGRRTRNTGVQSLDSDHCPQCTRLLEHDNLVNDTGGVEGKTERDMAWCESQLAIIEERGGDREAAKRHCPYIWPSAPVNL